MVRRNTHVAKIHSNYLFPEIIRRKQLFLEKNPEANLISLGIGDTTEPLPLFIAQSLAISAEELATEKGYTGYGPEEGYLELRKEISSKLYHGHFEANEIFISDGTNSDIGRLQILFGPEASLTVQDPTYPVYVDTGVILGQSSFFDPATKKYGKVTYLPCSPSNFFFPELDASRRTDLIYFCSPNNPTGAVATHEQLEKLVHFAKKNRSIIIFDTAYASFIQDPKLPRSIYEIPGAKEVAIELGSFSKMAGFTGVRLAWSIVPQELQFDEGHSVNKDWNRVHATFFNGASNISQKGGLAVLRPEGEKCIKHLIDYYMGNAHILRNLLIDLNLEVHGGLNAPYLWVNIPHLTSWEAFDFLLTEGHIVCAPGSGFGPAGEGFIRLSAFGKRQTIEEAASRLASLSSILQHSEFNWG